MANKTKSIPICQFKGCIEKCCPTKKGRSWDRFCQRHSKRATINRFLGSKYTKMRERVNGKGTRRPDLYLGLPILPKDVFMNWAKNHPDFLSLYKRWVTSNFDRKLTPVVNRMNPSKGYTLDNIEWLTQSQNCGLSAGVRSTKNKKAIYDLLGVNR
jgi:hypothetical protein